MMKLENKHCTIEQSKELVELGVVLETEKYWCQHNKSLYWELYDKIETLRLGSTSYPAPDVAELGMLLLLYCSAGLFNIQAEVWRHNKTGIWESIADINDGESIPNSAHFECKTEAQARCAALIWLIKEGHLKVEELEL